ncbi:Poly [ADP-ribose] polymerase 2 [Bagarius yarrelli]|uniref:Poly [ADP-ribose] polymerase n=1 Tax=Bagarius yarrelli TaxID=175774 RepID=A0A556TZR6_BAGYA|nr:Poly [ADP-ribose] polymerase 2 [Bagarius yarrelli]
MVKMMVMKGKAPVDTECKAKLGKAYVYNEGNDVYDVMLNQTNLQFNNNKYYLIQLLKDEQAPVYSVWMRWGRVGKVGQNTLVSCGGDLAKAKDVFMKKFFDKTKNEWTRRANFEKVPGKYDMVFMDYSSNGKDENTALTPSPSQIKPSQLDLKLQSLMELICDIKAMEDLRSPPIIRTEEELKEKIALLEVIVKYLQSTHAATHNDYTMTVLDIFKVERDGENDNFQSHLHNRMLLWHGSRLTNWIGILSQGLRVAPPEAPVTGYMVALGNPKELLDADYDADKLPSGKHSIKGLGQTAPDPKHFTTL